MPERSRKGAATFRTSERRIEEARSQPVRILGAAMRAPILKRLVVDRTDLPAALMNDCVIPASQAASTPRQILPIPSVPWPPLETVEQRLLPDAKQPRYPCHGDLGDRRRNPGVGIGPSGSCVVKRSRHGRHGSTSEDYEVRDWAAKFGVTKEQLPEAVKQVGDLATDVEAHLKGRRK